MEVLSDIKKSCKKRQDVPSLHSDVTLTLPNCPINVCNKRFDALFLPILTYSSEVWGAYDKNENTTWEKDTIEKTHINFCKVFLGVNKRFPNAASRNELGRLPLELQITQNIIKYWFHLKGLKKTQYCQSLLRNL